MRLSEKEVTGIKNVILSFEPTAIIYLYGSRTDDNLKGGDIDLMVLSDRKISLTEKIKIKLRLYEAIGEQKIDLLTALKDSDSPFVHIVKKEGIIL